MSDGGSSSSSAGGSGAQGATGTSTSQAEGSAQTSQETVGTDQEAAKPAEESAKPAEEPTKPAEETKKPEEKPPEDQPKHRHHDRLTKAYPDRQFNSPEDYDTALDEYVGGMEKENGELKDYHERGQKANQRLIALFEAEPEAGAVVREMLNGATFRAALSRHFSAEDLTPQEGDEDYEAWNKNKIAREEQATKRRQFEESYAKNLEMSEKEVADWAKENGMDQEKAEAFLGQVDAMIKDINEGKVTKDVLNRMLRAYTYEQDMAKAAELAETKGRNQKIVATKEEAPVGDGLPRVSKSSEPPAEEEAEDNWMSDLVNTEKKRQVF